MSSCPFRDELYEELNTILTKIKDAVELDSSIGEELSEALIHLVLVGLQTATFIQKCEDTDFEMNEFVHNQLKEQIDMLCGEMGENPDIIYKLRRRVVNLEKSLKARNIDPEKVKEVVNVAELVADDRKLQSQIVQLRSENSKLLSMFPQFELELSAKTWKISELKHYALEMSIEAKEKGVEVTRLEKALMKQQQLVIDLKAENEELTKALSNWSLTDSTVSGSTNSSADHIGTSALKSNSEAESQFGGKDSSLHKRSTSDAGLREDLEDGGVGNKKMRVSQHDE